MQSEVGVLSLTVILNTSNRPFPESEASFWFRKWLTDVILKSASIAVVFDAHISFMITKHSIGATHW